MRSTVSRVFTLAILGSIGVILIGATSGCTIDQMARIYGLNPDGVSGGGEDAITVPMPFDAGYESQCMQGAMGGYSHTGRSTKYDVDFDTPNSQNDIVFAPMSGTAYVHDEDTSSGFGLHINLDLDDGTYLILAHLSEVFVQDGDEVGAGQILAFEGTTGASTGDHLHFGRHSGDAALNGSQGSSVEGLSIESDAGALSTSDMTCDLDYGEVYTSTLQATVWHPSGTLLMEPSGVDVYVLDGTTKQLIDDESAFWSRGYDFGNVVYASSRELDCYTDGPVLSGEGVVTAVQDGATTWLLTGTGDDAEKRRVNAIAWSEVLASWGISATTTSDLPTADDLGLTLSDFLQGNAAVFRDGTLLSESGRSDVYVVGDGVAEPIIDWDTYLALGFFRRSILTVDSGAIAAVQGQVGSCATDVYCVTMDEVSSCGGENDTYSAASTEDTGTFDTGILIQDTGWVYSEGDGSDSGGSTTEGSSGASSDSSSEASTEEEGLTVTWQSPSSRTESRISLAGEYTEASGYSYGWRDLDEVTNAKSISYTVTDAASGDTLRFSVEFEDSSGNVSWSCLAPFPPGTVQGTATATYNGSTVSVIAADDPSSNGCGLTVTVP